MLRHELVAIWLETRRPQSAIEECTMQIIEQHPVIQDPDLRVPLRLANLIKEPPASTKC